MEKQKEDGKYIHAAIHQETVCGIYTYWKTDLSKSE